MDKIIKYYYEGKTEEEALKKGIEELQTNQDNIVYKVIEEKNSLLKKIVKLEIIKISDIIEYIKEKLHEITTLMNMKINLEVRRREKNIAIKLFSDNNALLIGKNGRTIQSLQNIIKQMVNVKTGKNISIVLDVENYKENRAKSIESLAKRLAREVATTKIETKMDSMNSYERRIVHSILSENEKVYTESVGEEPERCVVIKPKEV